MTSHNYHQCMFASLICFIIGLDTAATQRAVEDGVIVAFNSSDSLKMFCLRYFSNIFRLPLREDAHAHNLLDLTPWPACKAGSSPSQWDLNFESLHDEVVVVDEANCTVYDKAKVIQEMGGSGVIIVDSKVPKVKNLTKLNISVAIISPDSFQQIKALGANVKVIQYATPKYYTNEYLSLLIVWSIAVFCVILGAYWEVLIRSCKMCLPLTLQDAATSESVAYQSRRNYDDHKQETVQLSSPLAVVILVVCMCAMLLLIYFFYSYLVYVLIILYCLGAASSYYQLFVPIVIQIPYGKIIVKKILLFLTWMSLASVWFVYRKSSNAWILQNFFSIGLLTNVINVLRLPSFKIITILLVLLFLYDIFFVFITPLFTKNGASVMVEAASGGEGGSGGEQMPMVFKVPNFNSYSLCDSHYIYLGLGDVLFPGLLVGYCFRYKSEPSTKLYFIVSVLAYGCGLLFTFIGLYLMSSAQPALLYLVPTTLLASSAVALCRKEFASFWTGIPAGNSDEADDYDNETVTTDDDAQNINGDISDQINDQRVLEDDKSMTR